MKKKQGDPIDPKRLIVRYFEPKQHEDGELEGAGMSLRKELNETRVSCFVLPEGLSIQSETVQEEADYAIRHLNLKTGGAIAVQEAGEIERVDPRIRVVHWPSKKRKDHAGIEGLPLEETAQKILSEKLAAKMSEGKVFRTTQNRPRYKGYRRMSRQQNPGMTRP